MATRKGRSASKRKPARRTTTKRQPMSPAVKEVLMRLGQQALAQGVKEVLEDHGVSSSVNVEVALTKPRAKGGRKATKARKATKRRRSVR